MRLAPVALVVAGTLAGCGKPSAPPAAADPDIISLMRGDWKEGPFPDHLHQAEVPQDRDRMARLRAERLARARASTVEAYARVGRRDPKWDRAAEDGLAKVAAGLACHHLDPDVEEAAWEALAAAVRVGCDDPAVRYFHHQIGERLADADRPRKPNPGALAAVAKPLRDSRYPAVRRASAAHNYAVSVHPAPRTAEDVAATLAHPDFVAVRDHLRRAWADDPRGAAENIVEMAALTQSRFSLAPGGRDRAYEAYADFVDGLPGAAALGHWLKADYLHERAWATRGGALAREVPDADMRTFQAGLEAAGAAYAAAWEADPTRAEVAVGLMKVAGPIGDHDELEHWFRQAMTLDGDCVPACLTKGNYLHPKWGGHSEAVRQFAARLADTRNYHVQLPCQGVELLVGLRLRLHPGDVELPETDWALVERVFDDHLAARPDSRWAASKYLWFAWHNDRHAPALRMADRLDGRPMTAVVSRGDYDRIRAAARASVAAGHR